MVYDPDFAWDGDDFQCPPHNKLVIYELHVGSLHDAPGGPPGDLHSVMAQFAHLKRLGVNAVQLMPLAEFAGDFSWGYNPAHIFAVESTYGGPRRSRSSSSAAPPERVRGHPGRRLQPLRPRAISISGGSTAGGERPGRHLLLQRLACGNPLGQHAAHYGRSEVRQFLHDNAMMWLADYHMDGLRYDMTLYIRSVRGDDDPGGDLPEGWSLMQWINREIRARFPGRITIAEDLRNDPQLTRPPATAGPGFHTQWDANFVHPMRAAVIGAGDDSRSMPAVRDALAIVLQRGRLPARDLQRVARRGRQRQSPRATEVAPTTRPACTRRSVHPGRGPGLHCAGHSDALPGAGVLGRRLVPRRRAVGLGLSQEFRGIVRLYRDLVRLRLNLRQGYAGLVRTRADDPSCQ